MCRPFIPHLCTIYTISVCVCVCAQAMGELPYPICVCAGHLYPICVPYTPYVCVQAMGELPYPNPAPEWISEKMWGELCRATHLSPQSELCMCVCGYMGAAEVGGERGALYLPCCALISLGLLVFDCSVGVWGVLRSATYV